MKKILLLAGIIISFSILKVSNAEASYHFSNFKGHPPIHIYRGAELAPSGLTPSQVKSFYNRLIPRQKFF